MTHQMTPCGVSGVLCRCCGASCEPWRRYCGGCQARIDRVPGAVEYFPPIITVTTAIDHLVEGCTFTGVGDE